MNMMTGAVKDVRDNRDYIFEALWSAKISEIDWYNWFNIEDEVWFKIPVKNQYNSYSCVWQSYAYYWWTKLWASSWEYKEISAKSIYSLIALWDNRWAYLRDGSKTIKNKGSLYEEALRSYNDNGNTNEEWMTNKEWLNEEVEEIMALLKAEDYYMVTDFSIDWFARAIKEWGWIVAWITGTNNWTWSSEFPVAPSSETPKWELWWHALFFWRFRMRNWSKEIWFLNSWWESCWNEWWQWLTEEWFRDNGILIFNPWVLINKEKNMNINEKVKILKDKNSSAVWVLLPAISEDVLKSYCLNMNKQIVLNASGEIDWKSTIDWEFEEK